jgi:hypothetical protein
LRRLSSAAPPRQPERAEEHGGCETAPVPIEVSFAVNVALLPSLVR